jgi:hypothetical protein
VGDLGLRIADCGFEKGDTAFSQTRSGVIILRTVQRDSAETLSDILHCAHYATVWQPLGQRRTLIRGVAAGIWDGGQLSDAEAGDLRTFCNQMARDAAPVLALLDFPRRDRVDHALEIGAAAVLGKPWLNADLMTTLDTLITAKRQMRAA